MTDPRADRSPVAAADPVSGRRPWPRWSWGQTLGFRDLDALEDFLLARSRFPAGPAHGVASLPDGSVRVEGPAGGRALVVDAATGLTPAGQPVWVGEEDLAQDPLRVALPEGAREVDTWIEVGLGASSKLGLAVEAASSGAPALHPRGLYLGRYRVEEAGEAPRTLRPLCLCLGALGPWDEAWERWTEPLYTALLAAGEQGRAVIEGRGTGDRDGWERTWLELREHWTEWDYVRLGRALDALSRAARAHEPAERRYRLPPARPPWRPPHASGEDQPRALLVHHGLVSPEDGLWRWWIDGRLAFVGRHAGHTLELWLAPGARLPPGRLHVELPRRRSVQAAVAGEIEPHVLAGGPSQHGWRLDLSPMRTALASGRKVVLVGLDQVEREQCLVGV